MDMNSVWNDNCELYANVRVFFPIVICLIGWSYIGQKKSNKREKHGLYFLVINLVECGQFK